MGRDCGAAAGAMIRLRFGLDEGARARECATAISGGVLVVAECSFDAAAGFAGWTAEAVVRGFKGSRAADFSGGE
jgi:hypothetical protein